jgi:hypothetical protein
MCTSSARKRSGITSQLLKHILTRHRRLHGDDHPAALNSAHNLAVRLRALGRHDEALTLSEGTLQARRRVLGSEHPATLRTATGLAIRLAEAERVEEAVVLGEETLEDWRRVFGPDHPDTLDAVHLLERLKRQQAEGEES